MTGLPAVASTRLVVAGKGGVGKSTVTAVAARLLARGGLRVVAVDADEQMNLGPALGVDPGDVVPLARDTAYVAEKTGAVPGAGGLLRIDPDVGDALERLAAVGPDGVRLLVMGGVRAAGGGCLCPEHTVLAAVVASMGGGVADVVLMDTHAGVEHFGRALARGFDQALVVTDPSYNAVEVAVTTARLAAALGIGSVHLVVNRVRRPDDLVRVGGHLADRGGVPFSGLHPLPYDEAALDAEPAVDALLATSALAGAIDAMLGAVLGPGAGSEEVAS